MIEIPSRTKEKYTNIYQLSAAKQQGNAIDMKSTSLYCCTSNVISCTSTVTSKRGMGRERRSLTHLELPNGHNNYMGKFWQSKQNSKIYAHSKNTEKNRCELCKYKEKRYQKCHNFCMALRVIIYVLGSLEWHNFFFLIAEVPCNFSIGHLGITSFKKHSPQLSYHITFLTLGLMLLKSCGIQVTNKKLWQLNKRFFKVMVLKK